MNAYTYSLIEEKKFREMARYACYEPISTFYADLSIAEWFEMYGNEKGAIEDTFNNVCASWLNNYKMFTEFVLCLNWKIWELYEDNDAIARIYNDLWEKAENLFIERYEDNEEAKEYFYRVTD